MQVVYNVFDQNPEDELFPVCRELGVAVIARVPFDEGSLTGTMTRDMTLARGRLAQPLLHAATSSPRRSTASTRCSRTCPPGMTLPELALRFILANPDVSTVIPGHAARCDTSRRTWRVSDGQAAAADVLARLRRHRWVRTYVVV